MLIVVFGDEIVSTANKGDGVHFKWQLVNMQKLNLIDNDYNEMPVAA